MNIDTLNIVRGEDKFVLYYKKIWKTCFGDSDEYIDFFFENKYPSCYCITAVINETPVGVTYLMPVSTQEYDVLKKGFYLYALGVLPEYQNKGIGKRIVKEICDFCIKNGFFCILSPASEELTNYYNKLGFIENAYITVLSYRVQNNPKVFLCSELSAVKLKSMRETISENMIFWDKAALDYVLKENSFVNGRNFCFIGNNENLFAITRFDADKVTVIESNIPVEFHQDYSDYFGRIFNRSEILWHMPRKCNSEHPLLCGMSFNLSKNYYYLNHILN